MPSQDPLEILADPEFRSFARDRRIDLLAPDVPIHNDREFVVYQERTQKNEIEIVRYVAPYVIERIDRGPVTESFRFLNPQDVNGHVCFSPKINGQNVEILDIDYNAPRLSTGTLANAERIRRGGIGHVTEDPWRDARRPDFLLRIPVHGSSEFLVTFEILPAGTVSPMPNLFQIAAAAVKRIDFAGVIVSGSVMSEGAYKRYQKLENDLYERTRGDR